ncbi:transporter [Ammoniphilus oxalaticus]|uniref:Transporter n=1 Tax=Ammoniphilus oxalaticus TaxID=66863 RepID=A0A419SM27_9BACL|nr:MFS transporter [Ammoniphilus oxalaticus]RKD25024.1 transporter [Ammoniphilus oxalaticus]
MRNQATRSISDVQKTAGWMMIAGIIFIAMNLRSPLTSVGPLIGFIKQDLGISNTLAGMITTLPLLAFAFFSPFVPRLSQKYGLERIIFVSTFFLTLGIVLRSLSGITALYVGTVILGLAISVSNVLLPSLIKREFSGKIGMMTGVYSISMNVLGAIASGLSVPLAIGVGLGWRGALSVWGMLSFVALFVWGAPLFFRNRTRRQKTGQAAIHSEIDKSNVNVWRSRLAWQVTFFMGLQSMVFYILIAWLPEILKVRGLSPDQSGWLLSLMQLFLLPFTFIVPIVAGRMVNQRLLVMISFVLTLSGTLGIMLGSMRVTVISILILGVGAGFSFSLAMMFFGLRARNAQQSAELSGMAQAFGYLLAASGPALFGYARDVTNSWTAPLMILVVASILLFIFGMGAGRNRYIDDV